MQEPSYAYQQYKAQPQQRVFLLIFATLLVGFLLIGRLVYLQLIKGSSFAEMAEGNRVRGTAILAPRGNIYDKSNKILATNKLAHALLFDPKKLSQKQIEDTLKLLSDFLDIPQAELREKLDFETRAPVYLKQNLSDETLALLLENEEALVGVEIKTQLERFYPEKDMAAHFLGYMGQITPDELKQPRFEHYQQGVLIGKNGLERIFETHLKGQDGRELYEINPKDKTRQLLRVEQPLPGNSLKLTIDKDLQAHCQQLLKAGNHRGAIVVMDTHTGGVLAMVSQPAFDLNLFIQGFTSQQWNDLQQDKAHPFLNRAINAYPPGSIFKMITALAALEEGYLTPQQTFYSRGFLNVGGHIFYDWNRAGFGVVNIYKALAYSIDTVFYELALKMGMDPIQRYAEMFRLHLPTGIELPHERKGLIPSPEWKKKVFKQIWLPGDAINASIGQGFVQLTPLQATQMVATIANEGKIVHPHLVEKIAPPDGKPEPPPNYFEVHDTIQSISPRHWQVVKDGMRQAVTYGTAKALDLPGIAVAGKTGTAETVPGKDTHAWIVAYAPASAPRYALTVFLEHGGSGGSKAAPVGRKVLDFLFGERES